MTQNDRPESKAGIGKWLAVSLAANLFLAGIVAGTFLVGPPFRGGPPPRPPMQMMVMEASGKLSPEGLQKLQDFADEFEDNFRKTLASMDSQRESIRVALLREPFDAAEFSRALDDLHVHFTQSRTLINQRFSDVVSSLSPADRKRLATVRFP